MELKNTIELMLSDNYKDRFRAEYLQLKIRVEKLDKHLLTCELDSFSYKSDQLDAMKEYLNCLEKRAEAEGINLD